MLKKAIQPNNLVTLLFLLAVGIGIFFRFFNIAWGHPFFFHPDERNIASSVSQITFPEQMNPKFFAYGSLPIYSIYFVGIFINFLQNIYSSESIDITHVSFESAIIIGRSFSLFFSIVILYLIYSFGNLLSGRLTALISTFLAVFSIGFIQYSHFATFEMWLSFFVLLLCYLSILFTKTQNYRYFIYSAIVMGVLVSIKISSFVFAPFVLSLLLIPDIKNILQEKKVKNKFIPIEKALFKIINFSGITMVVIYLTSPFFWLDNKGFISSIRYESDVALGNMKVFYSQIFENTTPFIYQFTKVFPFILNPFVAIFSILSLIFIVHRSLKYKNKYLNIVIIFFAVTFLSQVFLYVKWIRYYIPTLSFIYLFLGLFITWVFLRTEKHIKSFGKFSFIILIALSLLYSFSYFKTVLYDKDTRLVAADWANTHIPHEAKIMSEVYDLGIVPFNNSFTNIELFNFYDLETDKLKRIELYGKMKDAEYIILPSQRILQTRINNPELFPAGNEFYKNLFNKKSGYQKVFETGCDIFCKILYLNSPVYSYEQTANVFDRPTIFIFKKVNENK